MKKAFTLIELIVVVTIIGVLLTGGVVSYTSLNKSSRDARRKSDLEQIRAALEMYRSTNNFYPAGAGKADNILGDLIGDPKYIETIPLDPKDAASYIYYYESFPAGCDNGSEYCNDYIIYAYLESGSVCSAAGPTCISDTGELCNYCLGPYGQKQ